MNTIYKLTEQLEVAGIEIEECKFQMIAITEKIEQLEIVIQDALNREPSNTLDGVRHYNRAMQHLQVIVDELKGKKK